MNTTIFVDCVFRCVAWLFLVAMADCFGILDGIFQFHMIFNLHLQQGFPSFPWRLTLWLVVGSMAVHGFLQILIAVFSSFPIVFIGRVETAGVFSGNCVGAKTHWSQKRISALIYHPGKQHRRWKWAYFVGHSFCKPMFGRVWLICWRVPGT